MNIREATNQVILEERVIAEANNVTVDTFMGITMINDSENLINEIKNLAINDVVNDMIDKVTNMKIRTPEKI